MKVKVNKISKEEQSENKAIKAGKILTQIVTRHIISILRILSGVTN